MTRYIRGITKRKVAVIHKDIKFDLGLKDNTVVHEITFSSLPNEGDIFTIMIGRNTDQVSGVSYGSNPLELHEYPFHTIAPHPDSSFETVTRTHVNHFLGEERIIGNGIITIDNSNDPMDDNATTINVVNIFSQQDFNFQNIDICLRGRDVPEAEEVRVANYIQGFIILPLMLHFDEYSLLSIDLTFNRSRILLPRTRVIGYNANVNGSTRVNFVGDTVEVLGASDV